MPGASGEVTIRRPVEEVFAFLADGENNPRWRAAVTDISLVAGDAGQVGAAYRQGMRGPGGRIPADYRITIAQPGEALAFTVTAGPVRPEGRYDFETVPEGTRVRFRLSCQLRGLARLLAPMVARQMPKEIASLTELKRVLESAA
jgi:uncharacterized protein YndB with AHSA1/START domain